MREEMKAGNQKDLESLQLVGIELSEDECDSDGVT